MDPFGLEPLELIAIGDRGKESRLKTVGLRLETGRGAGIHVGLHSGRIHVMARGAVLKRGRFGERIVDLTVGYLQLVVVLEPEGLAFEVRPMGELGRTLLTGSNKVSVLNGLERPRATKARLFKFQPVPGADVQIRLSGTKKCPKVILTLLNRIASSPPGKWRTEFGMFLHTPFNSTQVLIRKVRVATLPS